MREYDSKAVKVIIVENDGRQIFSICITFFGLRSIWHHSFIIVLQFKWEFFVTRLFFLKRMLPKLKV